MTGGSGFIGERLVQKLRKGCDHVLAPRRAELDITDCHQLKEYFRIHVPRTVFHLATITKGRRDNDSLLESFRVNTLGSVNLLEVCLRAGDVRLMMTGTGDETGTAEDTDGLRTPEQPKKPASVYAATKAAATLLYEASARFSELKPTVLRLFAVYGPGHPESFFLPQIFRALRTGEPLSMTGGNQRRDFTWLDDVVDVMIKLSCNPETEGRTIDVCTGVTHTLREVVALVEKLSGQSGLARYGNRQYRPTELFRIAGDPSPLRSFVPDALETDLAAGLQRLLNTQAPRLSEE